MAMKKKDTVPYTVNYTKRCTSVSYSITAQKFQTAALSFKNLLPTALFSICFERKLNHMAKASLTNDTGKISTGDWNLAWGSCPRDSVILKFGPSRKNQHYY